MTLDLTTLTTESLTRRDQLLGGIAAQLEKDTDVTRRALAEVTIERARRVLARDYPHVGYLEFTYGGLLEGETEPLLTFQAAYTFAGTPINEIAATDLDFGPGLDIGTVEVAVTDLDAITPDTSRVLAVA